MIEFAKIIKLHGIKGNFVIRSNFLHAENYLEFCHIFTDNKHLLFRLTLEGTLSNGDLIVKNHNIVSVEDVKKYINFTLYIDKNNMPKLENEIYAFEIIGFDVFFNEKQVGVIADIVDFGSGPMLEISDKKEKEKLEYLLYNNHTIKKIDLEGKRIIVNLPEYV